MKQVYSLALVAAFAITGCCQQDCLECPDCSCVTHSDIEQYYGQSIDDLRNEVKKAFDDAEKLVLGSTPKPDAPKGPHEDPEKCICEGTGKIRQGDGHVTPCPYHSGDFGSKTKPRLEVDGQIIYKK